MKIDINEKIKGCENFHWYEFLYLKEWKIHCFPTYIQRENIIEVAKTLQEIRNYLGQPIYITSGLRPDAYNKLIGGSKLSAHKLGKAVDFVVNKIKPDRVRELLEPVLDDFDICMENLPGSSWVHIDILPPRTNSGRFFKP